jgi:hypothetical protein
MISDFRKLASQASELYRGLRRPSIDQAVDAAREFIQATTGVLYSPECEFQYDQHESVTPLVPSGAVKRPEQRDSLVMLAVTTFQLARSGKHTRRVAARQACEQFLTSLDIQPSVLAPPEKREDPSRIRIDKQTNSITLDETTWTDLDPDAVAAFAAFAEAKFEGEDRPIPSAKVREKLPDCHHDVTLRRWLDKLPKPVRACIKSKPGRGRWLQLPKPPV